MYILFPRLRLRVSAFALPGALLLIYCEGLLPFCILFLSCLLHEFGHLAALCICKCRYRRMDILPMGALIVCPEGMPYKKELAVALAAAVYFALDGNAGVMLMLTLLLLGAAE